MDAPTLNGSGKVSSRKDSPVHRGTLLPATATSTVATQWGRGRPLYSLRSPMLSRRILDSLNPGDAVASQWPADRLGIEGFVYIFPMAKPWRATRVRAIPEIHMVDLGVLEISVQRNMAQGWLA